MHTVSPANGGELQLPPASPTHGGGNCGRRPLRLKHNSRRTIPIPPKQSLTPALISSTTLPCPSPKAPPSSSPACFAAMSPPKSISAARPSAPLKPSLARAPMASLPTPCSASVPPCSCSKPSSPLSPAARPLPTAPPPSSSSSTSKMSMSPSAAPSKTAPNSSSKSKPSSGVIASVGSRTLQATSGPSLPASKKPPKTSAATVGLKSSRPAPHRPPM